MFDPPFRPPLEQDGKRKKHNPSKSPLPAMRWTIYLIITGILMVAVSHKFNSSTENPKTYSGVELAIRPELADQLNPDELLRMATEAMSMGRHPEAVAFFEKMNERMPENAEYLYWLALAKVQMGDFYGAEESFLKSLELSDEPNTRYYLGELYLKHLNRKADGEKQMQLVLEKSDSPDELKQKAQRALE